MSPGCASGVVCSDRSLARHLADCGEVYIYRRQETTAADAELIRASAGVVTELGGYSSHAAVLARTWGLPAITGLRDGSRAVTTGTMISINGDSGEIYAGALDVAPGASIDHQAEWFGVASQVVGDATTVLVNAELPADVTRARTVGAHGIGVCRTEHMFLDGARLALLQAVLATPDDARCVAQLAASQVSDLAEVLRAAAGGQTMVRLLDPPLHEFLPEEERGTTEHNPMMGLRGTRLGVVLPAVYTAQVQAALEAMLHVGPRDCPAQVGLMAPMVAWPTEARWFRDLVRPLVEAQPGWVAERIRLGVMIETPAACLQAGRLAEYCDFLSIGSNDLTQFALGLSRDDVDTSVLPPYLEKKLIDSNPFEVLDVAVLDLIAHAVESARAARSGIRIGLCGEHAADFDSLVRLAERVGGGVDYLSVSGPNLAPVRWFQARLALGLRS